MTKNTLIRLKFNPLNTGKMHTCSDCRICPKFIPDTSILFSRKVSNVVLIPSIPKSNTWLLARDTALTFRYLKY